MPTNASTKPRFVPVSRAAKHEGRTPATIYNWIRAGHIHAFRSPNYRRGVLVDLDEIARFRRNAPRNVALRSYGTFSPRARVVELTR